MSTDLSNSPGRTFPKTLTELRRLAQELGLALNVSEDLSVLARPVPVGNLVIPNSLAVHPMEGCDGDTAGGPGPLTFRRYERFAAGGAGLLWIEAIAVVPEGRANPRHLWIHENNRAGFADLVRRIRQAARERFGSGFRPVLVAQLTHSGRYSRPERAAAPIIAQHDPHRDGAMGLPAEYPVVTDEYLDTLPDAFARAARLAIDAGFDAVDLKVCHGYLMAELLGCHTRPGRYGGSFENRTRLVLAILDRIRAELGPGPIVASRLGLYDAVPFPFGWGVDRADASRPDMDEPLRLVALMGQRGVALVDATVGNPRYNPHYNRPYDKPPRGGYDPPEHPLTGVCRLIDLAGEVQRSQPGMAIVGTGYSWLRQHMPCVAAGSLAAGLARVVGAGRMAFAYPDFARDILERGLLDPRKVCLTCSLCTQIMMDGNEAGCPIRDKDVYGPILQRGRGGPEK
jgi:2,4-dienoyl-CoA reductase-like NADH-dependent reductase (Old Yellow Enzyme family)